MAHSRGVVTLQIALNLASAISIVFINKLIYIRYGFPSMTLTLVHFAMTGLGMRISSWLGAFTPKQVPVGDLLPLCFTFCGFVVLTNLSLQSNTVGTYQLAKAMTTPIILVVQTWYYRKPTSLKVMLTIIPVIFGIFLNSYYDVYFNIIGTIYATVGAMVTGIYQILVGVKQTELKISSMQLLYYQAPLSSLMLLVLVPFFEPIVLTLPFNLSYEAMAVVLLSGVIAVLVNLSIFWIIGKTSPLTYNMIGHCKFCITLMGGVLLFGDSMSVHQLLGVISTFGGVVLYTHYKMEEQKDTPPKNGTKLQRV